MKKSTLRKSEQLGIPFGTACGRLRTSLMFQLVQQAKRDTCFKCGTAIESAEELSIEHKEPWLDNDPDLFWDLDNIAFSHRRCNVVHRTYVGRPVPEGHLWCSGHQTSHLREEFYSSDPEGREVRWYCLAYRRDQKKW